MSLGRTTVEPSDVLARRDRRSSLLTGQPHVRLRGRCILDWRSEVQRSRSLPIEGFKTNGRAFRRSPWGHELVAPGLHLVEGATTRGRILGAHVVGPDWRCVRN